MFPSFFRAGGPIRHMTNWMLGVGGEGGSGGRKAVRIASLVMASGVRSATREGSPASNVAIASKSCRYALAVCGDGFRTARSARNAKNQPGLRTSGLSRRPDAEAVAQWSHGIDGYQRLSMGDYSVLHCRPVALGSRMAPYVAPHGPIRHLGAIGKGSVMRL